MEYVLFTNIIKLAILPVIFWYLFYRNRYANKCMIHLCDFEYYGDCESGSFSICPACEREKMSKIKKRPEVTSMYLQKYVGENWKTVKEEIQKTGLSAFCCEDKDGKETTISIARNVDIRYDRNNNEIVRIWRTE